MRSLDCHKLTVDEMLSLVDKELDTSLVNDEHGLIIVHGLGTFKLRDALQSYLASSFYVKSFREGNMWEGGLGATVVELDLGDF